MNNSLGYQPATAWRSCLAIAPEEPAQCALEIAEPLHKESGSKEMPQLRLRMGIHSGPVSEVTDLSGRTNITGGGSGYPRSDYE
jgi:class 3 adenylate cyclase